MLHQDRFHGWREGNSHYGSGEAGEAIRAMERRRHELIIHRQPEPTEQLTTHFRDESARGAMLHANSPQKEFGAQVGRRTNGNHDTRTAMERVRGAQTAATTHGPRWNV